MGIGHKRLSGAVRRASVSVRAVLETIGEPSIELKRVSTYGGP